jgi:hypothetical protein
MPEEVVTRHEPRRRAKPVQLRADVKKELRRRIQSCREPLAEEDQVAGIRRHIWEEHSLGFSAEEAGSVLLRSEHELDESAPTNVGMRPTKTSTEGGD